MSNYSLLKTINGLKVEAGEANAYHSRRWTDLDEKLCPKRDMYDIAGRGPLCADSLFAGTNGCVPAIQRINAENDNRPKYSEYISRARTAIAGDSYETQSEQSMTMRKTSQTGLYGFGNIGNNIRTVQDHGNY